MHWWVASMLFKYLIFKRVPNCRYPYFHAFGIGNKNLEQFEEVLSGILEPFDDGFQHSVQDVCANFALRNLRRSTCVVEP